LSDDGRFIQQITNPRFKLPKCYRAQVEGRVEADALGELRAGVTLKDGPTRPATARLIDEPEKLWPRDPPVRYRREIPTSWIELEISEGRNRQVRRMTAAVGHPTLRLIRWSVGDWTLGDLQPGEYREL
jgi:23S rRNA pseudouridine2457 synthase